MDDKTKKITWISWIVCGILFASAIIAAIAFESRTPALVLAILFLLVYTVSFVIRIRSILANARKNKEE